jgi:hypothetical protein
LNKEHQSLIQKSRAVNVRLFLFKKLSFVPSSFFLNVNFLLNYIIFAMNPFIYLKTIPMNSIYHIIPMKHVFMLLKVIVVVIFFVFATIGGKAQVSINTTGAAPHASAMLDITATGKGLLIPRMTYAQLPVSPATGLIVYVTDVTPGYYFYDATAWRRIGLTMNDYWLPNGSNIYFNAGRVAVGTTDPENHGFFSKNYVTGKSAVRGADASGSAIYADGMLGVLNYPGALVLPVYAANIGVLGIKPNLGMAGEAV